MGRVVTGKTPSKNDPQDWGSEIGFITPTDLESDDKHFDSSKRRLSKEGSQRFDSLLLPNESILVTCIGTIGKVVMNKGVALTNQQINSIIVDTEKFDKDFAFYKIKSLVPIIKSIAIGSTMPIINKSAFENIEFEAPNLLVQKQISQILSAYDAKIENNNSIIKNLETIAETIFDEWFVRFHFPGFEGVGFVDSEIGRIPEGWQISSLGKVSNNHDSKRIPLSSMERSKRKGHVPYYGANGILDYVNEAIFSGEYILFAEDGTVKTKQNTPVVYLVDGDFWVNNHAHILSGKNISNYFLYLALRKINIDSYITGGVQPKITQQNLNSIPVIVPKTKTKVEFEKIIQPINDLLKKLAKENNLLKSSRDRLLVRLM